MAQDAKVVPVSPETSTAVDVARAWQQPREVSLEEVAEAIVRLSRIDEGALLALASEGKLWTVFPYTATHAGAAEPEAWNDAQEAPGPRADRRRAREVVARVAARTFCNATPGSTNRGDTRSARRRARDHVSSLKPTRLPGVCIDTVNIHQAKTHLSRLVEDVAAGAEFVIAKNGVPRAKLVPLGRVPPLLAGVRGAGFRLLGFDPEHALRVARLPRHHPDPFYRALVAQAQAERMRLLTHDPVLARYRNFVSLV